MKIEDIDVDRKFAKRLPEPSEGEFEALTDSIAEEGIVIPLVVTEDGLLLDGHRRLKAAKELELKSVPVTRLKVRNAGGWEKTMTVALNLKRRHLNAAQRSDLGSSILRIERKEAKARMVEGGRKGGQQAPGNCSPGLEDDDRATERAGRAVGVSRKTFERVEKVKKKDKELHGKMLAGKVSIAGAAKKIEVEEIKERGKAESSKQPGLIKDLRKVTGNYRCVYIDPAWPYGDSGSRGVAEGHYPTMSIEDICALPIGELLHADGGHVWTWTTWPKIRDGYMHRVVDAWGLDWVGEVVWIKSGMGTGRYIRSTTEILVLAVKGKGLRKLMRDDARGVIEVKKERHSKKPKEFREFVESASPGPRIEVFARMSAKGWDRYGLEA